jgi:hypothetical protein
VNKKIVGSNRYAIRQISSRFQTVLLLRQISMNKYSNSQAPQKHVQSRDARCNSSIWLSLAFRSPILIDRSMVVFLDTTFQWADRSGTLNLFVTQTNTPRGFPKLSHLYNMVTEANIWLSRLLFTNSPLCKSRSNPEIALSNVRFHLVVQHYFSNPL